MEGWNVGWTTREDGWGEVKGVVREGEGTGIRQRKVYLSSRSLLDPCPSALGQKDKGQGFGAQQRGWEERSS